MDDKEILTLYWNREEAAIAASAQKYGHYCGRIAGNILSQAEDVADQGAAEECVNDTWLRAWNAIPPHRPAKLSLFLGKITRELAIDRYRAQRTQKRGGGVYDVALEELEECLWTERDTVERAVEGNLLGEAISRFLWEQPPLHRDVFVLRYYHFSSIQRIAKAYAIGESKTKSILFRTRKKLRVFLESEGLL